MTNNEVQSEKLPAEMQGQFSWSFVEKATEQAIASYLRFVAASKPTEVKRELQELARDIESGKWKQGAGANGK